MPTAPGTRRSPAARTLLALPALAVALAAAACAGRYGSARLDAEVGRAFDAARVLPAHRYYTTGSDTAPDAIVALREGRPLQGGLWREVAMTPELLARLTDRMRGARSDDPHGRVLLDDRGERIGAWYSFFAPAPLRLTADGGVVLNPPSAPLDERQPFRGLPGDRGAR